MTESLETTLNADQEHPNTDNEEVDLEYLPYQLNQFISTIAKSKLLSIPKRLHKITKGILSTYPLSLHLKLNSFTIKTIDF
jgi:hypothetical protein